MECLKRYSIFDLYELQPLEGMLHYLPGTVNIAMGDVRAQVTLIRERWRPDRFTSHCLFSVLIPLLTRAHLHMLFT